MKAADLQRKGWLLVEDGNHGEYRPRPNEFGAGETAFIRAADMEGGRVLFENAQRISETARKRISKGIGAPGDVLLSHKGTVGKVALVPKDAPSFVCSPQTTFWRALDSSRVDRRYLYCVLRSNGFQRQLDSRKGETDMADYVSLTAQRELKIFVPPIEIQREIGNVLGALDDKIELNQRINRTLEAMAQAIFKSWFVDFDPVVEKADGRKPYGMDDETAELFPSRFQDSEIGPIPTGWKSSTIGGIARYVNGKNFTKDASGDGRMVIRIAELNSGPGSSTRYNNVHASPENTAYPGDLLFSWSGSLDVYRWHRDEALVNQHIFKVICDSFPQWFVHLHLIDAMEFFQGIASDKATTMGHIKREHLNEVGLVIPDASVLRAADKIVQALYEKIHVSERQSLKLAEVRDTLLPRLLSGEIRLGEPEYTVGNTI